MNEAWPEITAWRRQQRERLIGERVALQPAQHQSWSAAINAGISAGFALPQDMVVGFCWPFKNEFDARFAVRDFRARGALAALPLVVDKNSPLQFRKWWPGAPMKKGVYDIPFPDGTELLVPDIAFVPVNGFDAQCYRLGYGGGYFDRTLAAQSPQPVAVGVGFGFSRLPTIYPQPHDVAMDFIVTEEGIFVAEAAGLSNISAAECGVRLRRLLEQRGLPRHRLKSAGGYSSPACYAGEFPGYFGEKASGAD